MKLYPAMAVGVYGNNVISVLRPPKDADLSVRR